MNIYFVNNILSLGLVVKWLRHSPFTAITAGSKPV